VVESDQYLLVLSFRRFNPSGCASSGAAPHGCVVGGDIANDARAQLLPERARKHAHLLIVQTHEPMLRASIVDASVPVF